MRKIIKGGVLPVYLTALVAHIAVVIPERVLPDTGDSKAHTYCYEEKTGDETSRFYWQISEEGQSVEIRTRAVNKYQKALSICRKNGETDYWFFSELQNTGVSVSRVGNTLRVTDNSSGKQRESVYEIDEHPWFQPLSYSLRTFLSSADSAALFWSVRQDTLDVVRLRAARIGTESLVLDGAEVAAVRVEIRMSGFLAPFWHGTYWYRLPDLLFLQYQGIHGPPGTAETTIRLMKTCD